MKLYPYGTFPTESPEWFAKALAEGGMNASAIPLWHLDKTEDWSVPAAFFLKMPPNYTLFKHGHPCQRFEVVIQGSLDVGDGRTAGVGDIFTAESNTLYGPHTAGPEGCTTIEIFSAVEGMFRLLYEGPDGEILEADARKGEVPPGYVPLPGDEDAMISLGHPREMPPEPIDHTRGQLMTLSPLADISLPPGALLIGDTRLSDTSAGTATHYFAATGEADPPIPMAGGPEIDLAVAAARTGFLAWSSLTPDRRRDALLRVADLLLVHADELVALSVRDSSFPLSVARLGPERAAGGFRYYAGWADKIVGEVVPTWFGPAFDYAVEEPYGVIAFFATWNTPVYNIGLSIAPALAAGNAVIIKPSELAPYAYLRFGEICLEAGLPPGTVNVVPGGAEAGSALTVHPGVDKVHFTGGGPTGSRVAALAASVLKPIDLELGGKSANLVFPDADVEEAVRVSVGGIVGGSGQTCITAGRMLVHHSIADEAVDAAVRMAESAVLGHPFDPATTMGPVISAPARERMLGLISRAEDAGATLCTGGRAPSGELAAGFYLQPTVLRDVDPGSELSQNEVYGPVLAITSFTSDDEAIAIANGTPYGLSAYIQTNDVSRAHRMAARLQSGSVYVNGRGGLPPGVPFGGMKQSGYGRLGGRDGLRAFMQVKNVWIGL